MTTDTPHKWTPIEFVTVFLGIPSYWWQDEILDYINCEQLRKIERIVPVSVPVQALFGA